MTPSFIVITACLAGTVLIFEGVSGFMRRYDLSEPALALLLGAVVGPISHAIDFTRATDAHYWLEEEARLTLAIGVFGIALRLPRSYWRAEWKYYVPILGLGMPLMWLFGSSLFAAFWGGGLLTVILAGAILTPTDPIVSSSIVTASVERKHVSLRLRSNISGESGANDGLAYLFVLLPIELMRAGSSGEAWKEWVLQDFLRGIVGSVLVGALLGWAAGKGFNWSRHRGGMHKTSYPGFGISLSVVVVAVTRALDSDGILAALAAGVFFAAVLSRKAEEQERHYQEAANRLFFIPFFFLFGMLLPIHAWSELPWFSFPAAIGLILLRRMPAVLLLRPLLRKRHDWPETLFVGWFGAIGVSGVFYALLAEQKVHVPDIWPVTSLIIATSIVIHGTTAGPFARWLNRVESQRKGHS